MKRSTVLSLLEDIKACDYHCKAGPLENNLSFMNLMIMAKDELAKEDEQVVYEIHFEDDDMIDYIKQDLQMNGPLAEDLILSVVESYDDYLRSIAKVVDRDE